MRVLRVVFLLALLVTVAANVAGATTITYIFTGVVSGVIGTTDFADTNLTLTAVADTGSIVENPAGQFRVDPISATITLSGIGTFTVTGTDYVFDNQTSNKVGYGVEGLPHCCDIIQVVDPAFGTYDLFTAIGPIGNASNLSVGDWVDVPTSGGLMTLRTYNDSTFQAVISTPEPASMLLLGSGLIGLALRRKVRR